MSQGHIQVYCVQWSLVCLLPLVTRHPAALGDVGLCVVSSSVWGGVCGSAGFPMVSVAPNRLRICALHGELWGTSLAGLGQVSPRASHPDTRTSGLRVKLRASRRRADAPRRWAAARGGQEGECAAVGPLCSKADAVVLSPGLNQTTGRCPRRGRVTAVGQTNGTKSHVEHHQQAAELDPRPSGPSCGCLL